VETPNPKLREPDSPFFINTEARPWMPPEPGVPRRAGVSSFGFGGTNFHAVLEEYEDYRGGAGGVDVWPGELCVWNAASSADLDASLAAWEARLQAGAPSLASVARTLATSAVVESHGDRVRLALVARDLDDLRRKVTVARDALRSGRPRLDDPKGIYLRAGRQSGKLAFLFPGQGSQAPHMLRDLAVHFPHIRQSCEEADRLLDGRLGVPLSSYIFPPGVFTAEEQGAQMKALTDTVIAQPALGAVEMGLCSLLADFDIRPDMVGGHSYGEYVALAAAGVISARTLLGLSEARGRAIKESVGEAPGAMAAVGAPADTVRAELAPVSDAWIANLNAPRQTIISGTEVGVRRASDVLAAAGLQARAIPVACAFHSPLMEPAASRLAAALAAAEMTPPRVPVYSNTLAGLYPADPAEIRTVLAAHLVTPVNFVGEILAMHDDGARIFVEVGPKQVLAGLARQILQGREADVVSLDVPDGNGVVQLLHALGQLAVAGVALRFDRLFEGRAVEPLDLGARAPSGRDAGPGWIVNGSGARLASEPADTYVPVSLTALAGVSEPVLVERASVPALAAAAPLPEPVAAPPADAVMLQFQSLMSQFLHTQASVMGAYLGSLETGGVPIAMPLAAATAVGAAPPAPTIPAVAPAVAAAAAPTVPEAPRSVPIAPGVPDAASAPRDLTVELRMLVSERTGYPLEMLDSDLNLEADLGVDSIKRVEILSAFQQRCSAPERTRVQAVMERLSSRKSLREMAAVLTEVLESGAPVVDAAGPAAVPAPSPAREDVADQLLRIVSQRTGYPAEMLDPDLNIEADLGIDSIKRVEILSAFQHQRSADEQRELQRAMERLTSQKTLRQLAATIVQALAPAACPERAERVEWAEPDRTPRAPERDLAPVSAPVAAAASEDVPRFTLGPVDAPLDLSALHAEDPDRVWLITDDETGIAEAVAAGMAARNERAIRLRHGRSQARLDASSYVADLADPGQVGKTLGDIRAAHGAPGGLLHLLPLRPWEDFETVTAADWRERVRADVKTLYTLVRATGPELVERGRSGGAQIIGVTSLGSLLVGGVATAPPTHGGIAAYLKTVGIEMPEVACRTIHLDMSDSLGGAADRLLTELSLVNQPIECGYSGGRRFTLAPRGVNGQGNGSIAFGSDAVLLMTGGARGITAEIARHLGALFRPRLVLVGKSPRPGIEAPDTSNVDSPQALRRVFMSRMQANGQLPRPFEVEAMVERLRRDREIRRNLEALERTGARVEYHHLDVRDETTFGALIDDIYGRYGRLDGVVHGAGVIEDKLVKDKTPESFDRVVGTKTDSAFTLLRRLRPEGLQFLVWMSSVTASFGNRGQADYGAANGILNALAATVASRWPARVRALNWGPWDKTGMVSEDVKRQFHSRGIQVIPVKGGVAAFMRELARDEASDPVVVVGGGPWEEEARRSQEVEISA
jgi:malonyl CoA-acyl carrier protein transacylase